MALSWSTPFGKHAEQAQIVATEIISDITESISNVAEVVTNSSIVDVTSPLSSLNGTQFLQAMRSYLPAAPPFSENITAGDFLQSIASYIPAPPTIFSSSLDDFMPAARLAREDKRIRAKHPIVIIPGLASTALEVWTEPPAEDSPPVEDESRAEEERNPTGSRLPPGCAKNYFRKRMWGAFNQLRALFLDHECWLAHMRLDPETGLDPPGARLRAAHGLDAADYLFPGYWVFAKLIQNLGAIGYDNNNSYDWRLSFPGLENRDMYFSRLKATIEVASRHGRGPKVVIIAHSMGNLAFKHFLGWVVHSEGGAAAWDWADRHLHAWVQIAAPMLGVPSAIPALLSGEMRHTASLNAFASNNLERFFSKVERAGLLRTWGSAQTLSPRGGEVVWGKPGEPAPDEPLSASTTPSFGTLIDVHPVRQPTTQNVTDPDANAHVEGPLTNPCANYSVTTAWPLLENVIGAPTTTRWTRFSTALGIATTRHDLHAAPRDPRTWSNPLIMPLPEFPSKEFRMYAFYGVGSETERKYFYEAAKEDRGDAWTFGIDVGFSDEQRNVSRGIQTTDGDVTVPLISLGYMCAKGWSHIRYNPSLVPCTTREYKQPVPGPDAAVTEAEGADHTSILGNHQMTEDLLRIVSGIDGHDPMENRFQSRMEEIAERVDRRLPHGLDYGGRGLRAAGWI
ncbi:hypothetical protein HK104_007281 [Borealophlyctis nickersoniae]|nr:hypothetical protein HK104_007281 [Borealophlyctis nickersoniae]